MVRNLVLTSFIDPALVHFISFCGNILEYARQSDFRKSDPSFTPPSIIFHPSAPISLLMEHL